MLTRTGRVALLKGTLAVAIWGGSFVATKIALRYLAPNTLVWMRFGMGVAVLGVLTLERREWAWVSSWRDLGELALLGFLGVTFHQWLQANGLRTVEATTTSWIVAINPILIVVLGWLFLREKLTAWGGVGIVLAAVGVLLVISRGTLSSLWRGRVATLGDYLILASALNWAVFSVLSRQMLKHMPAALATFYVMLLGWVFSWVPFLTDGGVRGIGELGPDGWLAVAFLGLFCSALAYVYWYDALHALPAPQVGALQYLEPLFTVALAAPLLGEPVRLSTLLGGGTILFGVWLVNRGGQPVRA